MYINSYVCSVLKYILQQTATKVTDEDESVAVIKSNDKYDVVIPTKEHAAKEYPTKTEYKHVEMLQFEGT